MCTCKCWQKNQKQKELGAGKRNTPVCSVSCSFSKPIQISAQSILYILLKRLVYKTAELTLQRIRDTQLKIIQQRSPAMNPTSTEVIMQPEQQDDQLHPYKVTKQINQHSANSTFMSVGVITRLSHYTKWVSAPWAAHMGNFHCERSHLFALRLL